MISVIIPAHNEKNNLENLARLLSSLEESKAAEILIALSPQSVNDFEAIDLKGQIQFLKCRKKGRAVQMNEASKRANGDVFVFLHADVKPPKRFFLDIQKAIQQGYDAGFFSYKFDKNNWLLKINSSFTGKDGIFTGGGDQCLFIKKEVFEKLGRYNEKQTLMEDFEFFRRMKQNKVPYTIIQNDLIVSARKYESNSYLRVNLSNLLLVLLFKLGYPGNKLKALHDKLIRTP